MGKTNGERLPKNAEHNEEVLCCEPLLQQVLLVDLVLSVGGDSRQHGNGSQRNLANRGQRSDFGKLMAHSNGVAVRVRRCCKMDPTGHLELHIQSLVPHF